MKKSYFARCWTVVNRIGSQGIPLKLFPDQEVWIVGELIAGISLNKIQFIDEDNQYLLIEFPTVMIPQFTEQLFFGLQKMGIILIIVHLERNRAILNDSNELLGLVQKWALAQLASASYIGTFGKSIQKISQKLIHFIASDAYNTHSRAFYMAEAYEKLEKEFGQQKVQQFKQTTKDLINGVLIVTNLPKQVKKTKFLGLF